MLYIVAYQLPIIIGGKMLGQKVLWYFFIVLPFQLPRKIFAAALYERKTLGRKVLPIEATTSKMLEEVHWCS